MIVIGLSSDFIFPLVVLFIHQECFGVSPSFGDIGHRDLCLHMNLMELDCTRLVVLKAAKKYI